MSAEQLAETLVTLDPTGQRVVLTAPGREPVVLAGHSNPALARAELDAVRAFVVAVLQAAPPADSRP